MVEWLETLGYRADDRVFESGSAYFESRTDILGIKRKGIASTLHMLYPRLLTSLLLWPLSYGKRYLDLFAFCYIALYRERSKILYSASLVYVPINPLVLHSFVRSVGLSVCQSVTISTS